MELLLLLLLLTGVLPLALSVPRRYYLIMQSLPWSDAQAYCRSVHTDLATVESAADLLEIQAEVQEQNLAQNSDAWIGLYKSGGWSWSLGNEPLGSYTKWDVNQPDNGGGNEDCVTMYFTGWADVTCAYSNTFTCFDATQNQLIYYNLAKNWYDAQSFCRQQHTDLASIKDDTTNTYIRTTQGSASWFGLHKSTAAWMWSDQTALTDVLWATGQPDNVLRNENCASVRDGNIQDFQCTDVKPFFCYSVITGHRLIVSLKVQSSQDPNSLALKAAILQKMKEDLGERVAAMNITLRWRNQRDGLVFHRAKENNTRNASGESCDLFL